MANVSSSNGLEKRPKLRFPGFDEPWKAIHLSDVGGASSGFGFPDAYQGEETSEIPFYKVSDMNLPKNTKVMQQSNNYVSQLTAKKLRVRPFSEDAIVFAKVGAAISHERKRIALSPFLIDNNMMAFTPKRKEDLEFIYHLFQKIKLSKYSQVGALPSYNANDILDIRTFYPTSGNERKKIVTILSLIDNRIEKQSEIITNLKKYKRGLLRDIFSKLNVRHDKRKLKDVAVLFADGDWIESKDQAPEGIRLVQTGNVGFGVYLDKPQNAKYISEATFHRLNCLEIYDGDILISRLPEPAGRACLLPQSTERRITAVDCTVIRTDKSVIDRTYLLQFLCSDQYLKTVNSLLAGGTRQRISRKNLEGIEVPYPSIDQQRYYGSFLCKVDARISNEENRLNCLSILRSSLLQQLFI